MGFKGLAIDLKQGWDLANKDTQDWVANELDRFPPEVLVICPPCTNAGGWFNLNSCYMSIARSSSKKTAVEENS